MSALIHRIYASVATPQFREFHVPVLLERIRSANATNEITGMLLYISGRFFQVLEGEPMAIDDLFDRILLDPRHGQLVQVLREPIERRFFGDWSMGFSTVDSLDAGLLIGERNFFQSASCLSRLDVGRSKKLLSAFGSGRWRLESPGIHEGIRRSV
jgi:Sensors of blue-light using FAD